MPRRLQARLLKILLTLPFCCFAKAGSFGHVGQAASLPIEGTMPIHEILTRGDLPHWYQPGMAHFVTYRLAGTIPAIRLNEWRERRERLKKCDPPPGVPRQGYWERLHKQFFAEYDRYLDANTDRQWLVDPRVAAVVQGNLHHHNGTKFQLLAYCVMPNHVHVLFQPFHVGHAVSLPVAGGTTENTMEAAEADSFGHVGHLSSSSILADELPDARSPLSTTMHSLKSYTANQANRILGRSVQFWQHESYDHWVRDLEELERIIDYIRMNPVKAGLCQVAHDWQFSSAFERFRHDGSESGLIGFLRDDWNR